MAQTMFERYGGFGKVHKIVMSFYAKVLDSDVMGPYFEDIEMPRLMDHQTKFISQVMGGPAVYSNEVLAQVHARLNVTDDAFDEMYWLLQETLEDFELDSVDIESILKEIKARRPWIVGDNS